MKISEIKKPMIFSNFFFQKKVFTIFSYTLLKSTQCDGLVPWYDGIILGWRVCVVGILHWVGEFVRLAIRPVFAGNFLPLVLDMKAVMEW